MQNYKVDYEHDIKEEVFNYQSQNLDGTIEQMQDIDRKGTISVWEQRILKKWKDSKLLCTVTDKEDLIDYDITIEEKGHLYDGMSYRILAVKKSNKNHWIDLFVTLGGGWPANAPFVEPYDASRDPEFDYNDITLAVEDYVTNNLYK